MPNFSTHLWVGRYYPLLGVMQTTSLLVVMICLPIFGLRVLVLSILGLILSHAALGMKSQA